MKLRATVRLSLPIKATKICLRCNTYEKATFDQYLASSIALHAEDDYQSDKYIDDITGNGSLNEHLKNLVNEARKIDKKALEKVMTNSLYPMTRIDKNNSYKFYQMFGCSVMNNRNYDFDLSTNEEVVKQHIIYDGELIDISYETQEKNEVGTYQVQVEDENISVELNGEYYPIERKEFEEVYDSEKLNFDSCKAKLHRKVDEEGNWRILTNAYLSTLTAVSNLSFVDANGDYCIIGADYVRNVCLLGTSGLHFYKETMYPFNKNNSLICEKAAEYLMKTNKVNEFKTKNLIQLLAATDNFELMQKAVNQVLKVKRSADIAKLGLEILEKDIKDGWETTALEQMKELATTAQMEIIYHINNKLDYTINDILKLNPSILTPKHSLLVDEYFKNRNARIENIKLKLGEISISAIREKSKSVSKQDDKNNDIKKFHNKYNKISAHLKEDVNKYSDNELDTFEKQVDETYELYLKVKDLI